MKKNLFIIISIVILTSCSEKHYEKSATFPQNSTLEEKLEIASHIVPTAQQLAWQKLETTVFFHFGINTFTGREWGDGTESPTLFNPTNLNTDQWCETVKNAGFKLVIITAKHHDGFCLWQTKTTKHSVAASPWKNGKGDIVKELQKSCEKYGLKFGIYLSPWDRNAVSYGDSPAYNQFFVEQLTELLTNYGKVDEVWFDGACGEGPNGKVQEYDFPAYYALIKKLMPNAVVAVSGDDVRWVGNEAGLGRDTEWSVTVLQNDVRKEAQSSNKRLGISTTSKELGSKELIEKADKMVWWPSEVDVSIRQGWFYHPKDDARVKTAEQLVNIYFNSVGKNSVLLLNIPPNKEGVIAKQDSINLAEYGEYLRQMYAENMLKKANIWKSKRQNESKIYDVKKDVKFNVIELAEDIAHGQRIESFSVETLENGTWKTIFEGTTIGYKRLLRLPILKAEKIRINIQARDLFRLKHVKAYFAEEFVSKPTIERNKEGFVSIKANENAVIRYTTDGTEPNINSQLYSSPFEFYNKGCVKAVAFYNEGKKHSEVQSRNFNIAKKDWTVVSCSAEEPNYEANKAIDDNENSIWHTPWSNDAQKHPHFISVDCAEALKVKGFILMPRKDMLGGIPYNYDFYISNDGKNWKKIISNGEFSNIKNNPVNQEVLFPRTENMRFFKFVALNEVENNAWCSVAEIELITE
ncbi:MAG: alpha-L-fucosidase [Paludibacteraceae bacterium]|nr:alpha-L-fucosidase [Paludibacteraceae bacterium]